MAIMNSIPAGPKFMIGIGIVLIVGGLFWWLVGGLIPLGKLPGDIAIEKENFRFYFPIATSILVSILISVILFIVQKWMK